MVGMRTKVNEPSAAYDRRWLTLGVICVSLMVIGLDNTILNVAVPTLARQLHASTSSLQWIVDTYTLVFAGLLLTAGSLGDRFGRYKGLTIGLAIFGTGSLASALSGSASMLIATRAFMGIGGAFIMPATLSIITNLFTDPTERGKAIGIWAGVSALGVGIGPVAGGFLLAHFYWGSVFFVNVPIVIVALIGGWFLVPDSRDPSAPKLDPLGAVLSIAGLATLLWAVIEAPTRGWGSTSILVAFVVGAAVLAGFVFWELHTASPMLDVRFFKNPRFTAASGAITLTFFTLFGSLFLLTQYLQSVLGFSPLKAGAVLVPEAVAMMTIAPLTNSIVVRIGNKVVVGFGLMLLALSMALFGQVTAGSSIWAVMGVTLVLGAGMGLIFAPATDSIMGSLPKEKAGVGSAMNDTTRQTGGAIGVAVLGSIMASSYRHAVSHAAAVHQVPAAITSVAKANVAQALAVAHSAAAGAYGPVIATIARHGYVTAFHQAVMVGAVVMLVAAIGVALWLPARAADPVKVVEILEAEEVQSVLVPAMHD
jgi:EmrB/QacA subfamily drug resistance transporter